MAQEPEEFVNRTQGWIGYTRINRKGDEVAESVEAGGRVFLTPEEQTLTARAHRRREDSPFVEREIRHYNGQTGEEIARFRAPLLERVDPEETAGDAVPTPKPAPTRPRTRRRKAPAVTA